MAHRSVCFIDAARGLRDRAPPLVVGSKACDCGRNRNFCEVRVRAQIEDFGEVALDVASVEILFSCELTQSLDSGQQTW